MNTQGHEEIAQEAGLPLLEEAFGRNLRSLHAFHLGNWLTDVSQFVEPVAAANVSSTVKGGIDTAVDGVKTAIDGFIDEMLGALFDPATPGGRWAMRSLRPELEPLFREARDALHARVDFLAKARVDERSARVSAFFRDAFLVLGYFKFVHPDEGPGSKPRMDFDCFMRVFGRTADAPGAQGAMPAPERPGAFTQYYPHEHMDRPEMLPSRDPPVYEPGRQSPAAPFRVALGKRAGTRSPRNSLRIEPDLYSYLRDQIEMTAGLLAEVDLEFKRAIAEGVTDTDPDWHLTLAKLGHAMHQVEDFFAHSNWVELAARRLGPAYLKKVIPPQLGFEVVDRASTVYRKRLKRQLTVPLADWQRHPDEDWVVTGFVDKWDTLISLAHASEELWGGDVADPYAEGWGLFQKAKETVEKPHTVVNQAQKAMRDALEFLNDPKKALDDKDNDVARSMKKKYGPDIAHIRRQPLRPADAMRVARETTIFKLMPPEIQHAFLVLLVEGTRSYYLVKHGISIYGASRELGEFFKGPVEWLITWSFTKAGEKVRKKMDEAELFYVKDRVFDWIGAGRIGCHSLMAKDHGKEPFHDQQKACATAVHWYIVKTLLRWKGDEEATTIDWLELLEYFLRNPLPPKAGSYRRELGAISVTLVHTVRPLEQLRAGNPLHSLEALYRQTAIDRDRFDWRTIADANFNTSHLSVKDARDTINRILRDNAWGVPVEPPNYAFKPRLRILIPQQKVFVAFALPVGEDPIWFREVLDKGWKVFPGFEDPDSQTSTVPLKHHTPKPIPIREADRIIRRGRTLRREAREAYRPT